MGIRHLVLVLGDQLDRDSAAFDDFDRQHDRVLMAEVSAEAERHPNHQQRIAVFLAAMRHFRHDLEGRGWRLRYRTLEETTDAGEPFAEDGEPDGALPGGTLPDGTLPGELALAIDELEPESVVMVTAGRHGLQGELAAVAEERGVPLDVRPDRHFLCSREDFADWAEGRKSLVMEHFYRWQRRRHGVLLDDDGEPAGGQWNFDQDNRESFGQEGPGTIKAPVRHRPDEITRGVLELVAERFADHPGSLEAFPWPVTREEALRDLRDFVEHRLPSFGTYQDALWTDRPFLYHSRLSTAMNLKLLHPREVIDAAVEAWEADHAPINAVEGFVRQILGWREFMRGVYWLHMPGYGERNALGAEEALPAFYWTGDTDMVCLRQVVEQLLEHGYAHHIQRLMVTGLFALLWGAEPRQVHDWYMALYTDSVEWVTLPNVVGMSQWADGGVVGTKPYVASGQYIRRMGNYCRGCRYDPKAAVGDDACPFTTLYWAFLDRHRQRLADNHRMGFQLRNLERKGDDELRAIGEREAALRARWANHLT